MTTALVTGASSGIGAEFARRYARLGYDLVLVARDARRLRDLADELQTRWHINAAVLPADLSLTTDCARVETRLGDASEPIDVLVNNAGYSLGVDIVESNVADEERMLRVLAIAPLRLTKAALPTMLARDRGSIITVASVAGLISYNSYGAAKSWAVKFSQALSLRLATTNVRAIALCPGLVHTEFHERNGVDASTAPRFMWLDVDRVVDECLRDLAKGKTMSIPSKRYRVVVAVSRRLPAQAVARLARSRGRTSRRR